MVNNISPQEYMERTLQYLEYMNFPHLAEQFNPEKLAVAMYRETQRQYLAGKSHRYCACMIFGHASYVYKQMRLLDALRTILGPSMDEPPTIH